MSIKLVAAAPAGKYKIGDEVTDPAEIAKIQAGALRKRFRQVEVHPSEAPFVPAPAAPAVEPEIE